MPNAAVATADAPPSQNANIPLMPPTPETGGKNLGAKYLAEKYLCANIRCRPV